MKQDLNGVRTAQDVVRRYDFEDIPVLVETTKEISLQVKDKVDSDKVISSINLSPEEATIRADKIKLEGYTTINNGFSVDESGNMTCNNAQMNNANVTGGKIHITTSEGTVSIAEEETGLIQLDVHHDDKAYGFNDYKARYNAGGMSAFFNENKALSVAHTLGSGRIYLYSGSNNNYRPQFSIYNDDKIVASLFQATSGGGALNIYDDNKTVKAFILPNGNITCVSLTQTSKEESKKDFEKLENALDIVKDTDIYKYHFKEEKETDKKHIGFVIGDNFKYRKELTDEENNNVELYSMISVLWKAVQEQQEEIEELKKKVGK